MKPILFIDFHGTLSKSYFWRSLDREARENIERFLFTEPNLATRDWMKGVYTSEQVNQMIAEEFDYDYDTLWSHFVEDCKTMEILKEILLKIGELRAVYTAILITDNMDCFTRFTVPSLGLDAHFDFIANSSDAKMLKNENGGEWFLKLAREFNSAVDRSILIDDSVHVGKIFSQLGGRSLLVNKENSLAYWLDTLEKI